MKKIKRIISACLVVILLVSFCFYSGFISDAANDDTTDIEKIQVRDDKLLLYPTVHDYAIVTTSNTSATVTKVAEYNMLDYIYIYTSTDENATGIALKDIYVSGKIRYRIYNEANSLGASMNNYSYANVVKVVIKKGCELPSYEYTNNNSSQKKAFVITEDITYIASNVDMSGSGLGTVWTRQVNDAPKVPEGTLTITGPIGQVTPYDDAIKEYLNAEETGSVTQYYKQMDNQAKDVSITWTADYEADIKEFRVQYATKSDYSDAIAMTVGATENTIAIRNLYKGMEYYVKVTAVFENGAEAVAESTFTTTAVGPRFMTVDGLYNVRDLGGYESEYGGTTKQGMIYRGGALCPTTAYPDVLITESGKQYMSDVLGIQLELDFRDVTEAGGHTTSYIPGATLQYTTIDGYASAFSSSYQEEYREVFQTLADEDNYPVYMHCTGGADRTGTVSFLLNALLGISEKELVQDYECTSFSLYGIRDSKNGTYASYYKTFREKLDNYEGDNLAEKTESYLLSIGVTREEIRSIRNIMGVKAPEKSETEVTNIHIRVGKLLLFLSNSDYKDKGSTKPIGTKVSEYNLYDNIVLYKSDTEYKSLREVLKSPAYYNVWGENGSVSFDLIDGWDGTTVKKVVIKSGCEFPSYAYTNESGAVKDAYVLENETTFTTTVSTSENINWVRSVALTPVATETMIEKIHLRHTSARLLLFLSKNDYVKTASTTPINYDLTEFNLVDNIILYKSDTEYKTVREILESSSYYNIWGETGSIAIDLNDDWNGTNVKKVVIKKGCEFPAYTYTSGGTSARTTYVITSDYTFITTSTSSMDSINWVKEATLIQKDTNVTGIRSGHNGEIVTFTLSDSDYNEAPANTWIGTSHVSYNYLDEIKIYSNDTDYVTLGEAHTNQQYYNMWVIPNSLSLQLTKTVFDNVTKIVIPAGTVFPSYDYTNNNSSDKVGYQTTDEIVYVKPEGASGDTNWGLENPPAPKEPEETVITGIKSGHNSTIVTFSLTNTDYVNDSGAALGTTAIGSLHTEYNYLSNILLYTSESEYVTLGEAYSNQRYYNMWGEANTVSMELTSEVFESLIKIVIPAGTVFPSHAYTNNNSGEIAGYITTEEVIYVKPESPSLADNIYNWFILKPKVTYDTRITNIHIRYADGAKLLVFLDTHDYPESVSTSTIDKLDEYKILNSIVLCRGDEVKTLAEVWAGGEKFYNIWGEQGCVAFSLDDGWNGETITKVMIESGCEFPSYAYTTGNTNDMITYVAKYDTEFLATQEAENNIYFERIEHITSIPEDTDVTNVKIMGLSGDARLIFELSNNDYQGVGNSLTLLDKFKDYNTLDNILLYAGTEVITLADAVNSDEVYVNLWGNIGTISYGLQPEYTTESFDKVVVLAGCEFPSCNYAATDSDEKIAYTVSEEQEMLLTTVSYNVCYYDENGQLLYVDNIVCGEHFKLRTVPNKKGYEGSWTGMSYDVMPAQDIAYYLSYEVILDDTQESIPDLEDDNKGTVKDDKESDKKSPSTSDAVDGVGFTLFVFCFAFLIIVECMRRKNRNSEF